MRYLGNKTKLVPFIRTTLESLGIEPGVASDPFSGTASVATALKRDGWRVHAGDVMAASYALQVARVELDEAPDFPADLLPDRGVATAAIPYERFLAGLANLPPVDGFITEEYARDDGEEDVGRMYFTRENGRRIDAIRSAIREWTDSGRIDRRRAQLLIATLVESADRVANTTGVYASYVKTLQPNAGRALELRAIPTTPPVNGSAGSTAFRGRAAELLRRVGSVDLVYLDPPYNARQYPGYYHIPELIAVGWFPPPEIRGKTGLIPDEDLRSDWCRAARAADALADVLEAADAEHVLFSYNDEGLLSREEIAAAMRDRGLADTYRCRTRPYRRYRSDSDGPDRTYARDRVSERLHYVRCR